MEEVRRPDDGELCGHVEARGGTWVARVVFGAELGHHPTRQDAVAHVLADGLASLAERWTLQRGDDDAGEVVCIQEANPHTLTVALGHSSLPGVPTLTIRASDIADGVWRMRRST